MFSRPIKRNVLQRGRKGVREDLPASRNQTGPVPRRKQQHDEHDSVGQPQDIQGGVQPQENADFFATSFRLPHRRRFLLMPNKQTRADNEEHEEKVHIVLPSCPDGKAGIGGRGRGILAGVFVDPP